MNKSLYEFGDWLDRREVSHAQKANNLQRQCESVVWTFDHSEASDTEKQWRPVFQNTVKKLLDVKSLHVVELFEGGVGEQPYLIVPSLEAAESLEDIKNREGKLSESEVIYFIKDILTGLKAMHKKELPMGQLIPKALYRMALPKGGFRYAITDPCVGKLSFAIRPDIYDSFIEANTHHCAPESLFDPIANEATDIYCVAQLALYLLNGSHPLQGLDRAAAQELYDSKQSLDEAVTFTDISDELIAWLKSCLAFLPNERLCKIDKAINSLPKASLERNEIVNEIQPEAPTEPVLAAAPAITAPQAMVAHSTTTVVPQTATTPTSVTRGYILEPSITGVLTSQTTTLVNQAGPAASQPTSLLTQTAPVGHQSTFQVSGTAAPQVLASANAGRGIGMWVFISVSALVVISAVVVILATTGQDVDVPEAETQAEETAATEDKTPKEVEPKKEIPSQDKFAKWTAHVQKHSPQLISASPSGKTGSRTVKIEKAERMSFEFICRVGPNRNKAQALIGVIHGGSNSGIYYIRGGGSSVINYNTPAVTFKHAKLTYNQQIHLVYVFEKDQIVMYRNGEKISSVPAGINPLYGEVVAIGGVYNAKGKAVVRNDKIKGVVSQVAVYNKALTADEVKENYSAYLPE